MVPCLHSRLLRSPFPGASQVIPPFFDASRPGPILHLLLESTLLSRACCPRRCWFTYYGMRAHVLFRALENQPRFRLECRCRAFAHLRTAPLAVFSRPLSRCYPLLYRSPVLRLLCADETSSAQWTIYVSSLHLLTLRREDARKG